jgi:hypothetical protein
LAVVKAVLLLFDLAYLRQQQDLKKPQDMTDKPSLFSRQHIKPIARRRPALEQGA